MRIYQPSQDHFVLEQYYPATKLHGNYKMVTRQLYETDADEISATLEPAMLRYSDKKDRAIGQTALRLARFAGRKKYYEWSGTLYGDRLEINRAISVALNSIAVGDKYRID